MTKNLPKLLAAKIQPPPEIMLGRQLDFQLDEKLEINRPKYLRQITLHNQPFGKRYFNNPVHHSASAYDVRG